MKKKDMVYLIMAVAIFLVAGYIGYTQLVPKKASTKTVTVETVGVISDQFDADGLKWLNSDQQVQDFDSAVDLTGLGNPTPFGP